VWLGGADQTLGTIPILGQLDFFEPAGVLGVYFVIRHDVLRVRDGERDVTKEGLVLVLLDELQSAIRDDVMGICATPAILVAVERQFPVVVKDVVGIEVVRMRLVQIAYELVEALFPRHALRADVA